MSRLRVKLRRLSRLNPFQRIARILPKFLIIPVELMYFVILNNAFRKGIHVNTRAKENPVMRSQSFSCVVMCNASQIPTGNSSNMDPKQCINEPGWESKSRREKEDVCRNGVSRVNFIKIYSKWPECTGERQSCYCKISCYKSHYRSENITYFVISRTNIEKEPHYCENMEPSGHLSALTSTHARLIYRNSVLRVKIKHGWNCFHLQMRYDNNI